MTFFKRLLFASSALLVSVVCGIMLVACDKHQNPMINQDVIGGYYGKMPLSDKKNYPLKTCSSYYGWNKHHEYKQRCDVWTEKEYKTSIADGSISPKTTLEEFRDPKFWQLVNPDAIEDR